MVDPKPRPDVLSAELHAIRSYSAHIQRVADAYKRLEQMALKSENNFPSLVCAVGRHVTGDLARSGEIIENIESVAEVLEL